MVREENIHAESPDKNASPMKLYTERPQYFIILLAESEKTLLNIAKQSMNTAAVIQGKRLGTSMIPDRFTNFAPKMTTMAAPSVVAACRKGL